MIATTPNRTTYDAVIVGARCAGAATAMLLARRGLKVLAVERSRYGSDTMSTHALMRGGVLQLHRWGVLDAVRAAGTPAVRRTSFIYGDEVVAVDIVSRDGVDALYSPRRTVLDRVLADAAADAGAELAFGVRVDDLLRSDDGRVHGVVLSGEDGRPVQIRSRIVIGADGVRSTVARSVGAEPTHQGRYASGVIYGYFNGLDVDGNRWYFAPGSGVGEIPTNDGDTCVFVGTRSDRFRAEMRSDIETAFHAELTRCAPELADAVLRAPMSGRFMAFAGVTGYLRRAWGPGWALVGDAGYFKDPITAHGITDALRDAELLADAVAAGSDDALHGYERRRDEMSLPLFELTDRIAAYDWTLPEVQTMHRELSREMNREVDAMLSWSTPATGPEIHHAATTLPRSA